MLFCSLAGFCEAVQHPPQLLLPAVSLLPLYLPFFDGFEQAHSVIIRRRERARWHLFHCLPHQHYRGLLVLWHSFVLFERLQSYPSGWIQSILRAESVPECLLRFLLLEVEQHRQAKLPFSTCTNQDKASCFSPSVFPTLPGRMHAVRQSQNFARMRSSAPCSVTHDLCFATLLIPCMVKQMLLGLEPHG